MTEPARDAVLGAPVAGIVGQHFFGEGDKVGAGEIIMELRSDTQKIEVERREVLLEAATATLERTRLLRRTTKSVSDEELEQAEADHAVAVAGHKLAQAELEQHQVTAPFAGEIIELFGLEAGEIARPQAPLVRLVDTSEVHFLTHLTAAQAVGLEAGDEAEISFEVAGEATTVPAEVKFVSPVADTSSGLLKVRAAFDNRQAKIRPGVSGVMTWD